MALPISWSVTFFDPTVASVDPLPPKLPETIFWTSPKAKEAAMARMNRIRMVEPTFDLDRRRMDESIDYSRIGGNGLWML